MYALKTKGEIELVNMRVKEIDFPCGFQEIVISENISNKGSSQGGRKINKAAKDVSIEHIERNINKVKKQIRRLALLNGLLRMMTLNFHENITDHEQAYKYLNSFIKKIKKEYPKVRKLKYIAVPELQARGAVHYHILLSHYIPQPIANRVWKSIIAGHVDIRFKGYNGIGYALKYIEKNLNERSFVNRSGKMSKSYYSSRNLNRDIKSITVEKNYPVLRKKGQDINNDDIQVIEDYINIMKDKGKVLYDNLSIYKIGDEEKLCRSILLKIK